MCAMITGTFYLYRWSKLNLNSHYITKPDPCQPRNTQCTNHLPPFYKNRDVYELWKQCIEYSIQFIDPIYCSTKDLYTQTIQKLKRQIRHQKENETKGIFYHLPINFEIFDKKIYKRQKDLAAAFGHEVRMYQLKHRRCIKCQSVSIAKDYVKCRQMEQQYQCTQCSSKPMDSFWKYNMDVMLPVWFDENHQVQYHVPQELQNLRLGEQLLIQRLSCFVPIVHIKHGIMGLHGNCVCFRQDIVDICNILPRTRANAIKIIRSYNNKDLVGIQNIDVFMIRKDIVLRALKWLKKFHKWYRDDPDLIIQETNLDWMGSNTEASLIGSEAETTNCIDENIYDSNMRRQDEFDSCGKHTSTKFILD